MGRLIAAVGIVLLATALGAAEDTRVTLYVGTQVRDGFVDVDKGVQDSIEDIKRALPEKGVRLVFSEERAMVRLYVLSRGFGPGSGSGIVIPSGNIGLVFKGKLRHVSTVLKAGAYERTIVGEDEDYGTWQRCANLVVKDLMTWIAANRARLETER